MGHEVLGWSIVVVHVSAVLSSLEVCCDFVGLRYLF